MMASAGTALGTLASRPARAAETVDLTDWFADVSNFDGVRDARGESEVRVAVGAAGNGGAFAFEPAAVRVDPGATVVWEWTGKGGVHDVTARENAFGSDLVGDAGHTFERAFADAGVTRYVCTPHEAMGMRGAVVVGDVAVTAGGGDAASTPTTPGTDAPDLPYLDEEPDYGDWFDGVSNYAGTVDARGREQVRVAVGAAGNGGAFAFEPAAVRVDPGTTVVWEWTGEGGSHDVVDDRVGYRSPAQGAAGATYALTFDGTGVSKYACAPHEAMGMRGAVVAGDPFAGVQRLSVAEAAVLGSVGLAAVSPLLFAIFLAARGLTDRAAKGGRDRTGDAPDRHGRVPRGR